MFNFNGRSDRLTMSNLRASRSFVDLLKSERRDTRDHAALEPFRPSAPGKNAVGGAGQEARAFDQCLGASRIEAAEQIGPRAVRAQRSAGAAAAIAEAAHRPHVH